VNICAISSSQLLDDDMNVTLSATVVWHYRFTTIRSPAIVQCYVIAGP